MWITQQFQTVLINLWFHFTWWDSRETYSWPANKGSSCFIICYSNQIKAATNPLAALEDEPFLMLLPGNQMKSLWDNRWDIIAFKDAIKSSIYWGNQWLWHTEDLIVWKKRTLLSLFLLTLERFSIFAACRHYSWDLYNKGWRLTAVFMDHDLQTQWKPLPWLLEISATIQHIKWIFHKQMYSCGLCLH